MKNAAEYSRRVKRLFAKLKKEGGPVHLPDIDDPMDQYLEGVLSNYVSESRAHAAVARLRAAMVDLNEMRVTPPSELVEVIGDDFPNRHTAAEALIRSLNAIYNKTHLVDLSFLAKYARKRAESFIQSLDGVSPYTRALVSLRCYGGQSFPLDGQMLSFLKKAGCLPPETNVEQAQKFLSSQCRSSELPTLFSLLKRHASAHAPRKIVEIIKPPPAPVAPPAPTPAPAAAKGRPPARPPVKASVRAPQPLTVRARKASPAPTKAPRRKASVDRRR